MYCGFSKKLLGGVVCQRDATVLQILKSTQEDGDVIFQGVLVCPKCKTEYDIHDGILNLLSGQEELDETLSGEVLARDLASQDYDTRLAPRYKKEIPSTLRELGNVEGKSIIEYGCGTGRFTVLLLSSEVLLANDFSRSSLVVLSGKLAGVKNVGLVLANAITLVTADDFFDKALSAQVLEHVPERILRNQFLKNIRNTLKEGGLFVCSMYHQDLRRRMQGKPKEGYHRTHIFFHYFSRKEVKNEFSPVFKIKKIKNIDITLPFEVRFNLTRYFKGGVSRFFEKIPFFSLLGHLVMVSAIKDSNLEGQKKIARYGYGLLFSFLLRKEWIWFTDPYDVEQASMVNFFSYNNVDKDGFHKKEALTTVIDLNQSLDDIWEKMRKNFIRKQILKGEKNGIIVRQDENFKEFKKIYLDFRAQKKLAKDNYEMLVKHGILFSAYVDEEMLAGGVFISDGVHMRAWVLSSKRHTEDGILREKIGEANRMILWEAIQYAKKTGHSLFDLGGIDPDSKHKEKVSLSEFKEGFGGERRKCYYYFKIYSGILRLWMKIRGI